MVPYDWFCAPGLQIMLKNVNAQRLTRRWCHVTHPVRQHAQ